MTATATPKAGHIDVISMGCSKNLVDSQRLMRMLEVRGYTLSHDPEVPSGEYVVVNTCGFIGDAKEESISLLLELASLKEEGRIGRIVVMGCLSQRYMDELKAEIPEVDEWFGKFDWAAFANSLPMRREMPAEAPKVWERVLTGNPWSAYIKISEGCDRFCAFCAIPLITGRHKSRPVEEILDETRRLVAEGVKEFNVIAQDLSSYGLDLYGRHALGELIDRMADIEGVEWIRLHYAYPTDFPYDVLPVMARRDNVCKYLDIALQHIADPVLERMRRRFGSAQTRGLIERIRREVPGIRLRTTMMVGFPGETEEDFGELLDFVREARFDRLGAFAYCEEEGTFAERNLTDDVPEDVKQSRLERLMEVQEGIASEIAAGMVGERVKVIIDRIEGDMAVGRTQYDSPEVDPEIYVSFGNRGDMPAPGDMIEAEVTSSDEFDLFARPC